MADGRGGEFIKQINTRDRASTAHSMCVYYNIQQTSMMGYFSQPALEKY